MPDKIKNSSTKPQVFEEVVHDLLDHLGNAFLYPLYDTVNENPKLISTVAGYLIKPELIIFYIGNTHIGIEFTGSDCLNCFPTEEYGLHAVIHDLRDSENIYRDIVGFDIKNRSSFKLPLINNHEDWVVTTPEGMSKLTELPWNFCAMEESITTLGAIIDYYPEADCFYRFSNCWYFDADESGLKTRNIKYLLLCPIKFDESNTSSDRISFNFSEIQKLVDHDALHSCRASNDYRFKHLPRINRFVELWGNSNTSEPEITRFLALPENKFILCTRFSTTAADVHSEVLCEWQSEEKPSIKPDFFIVQSNGYADIVEFKLPTYKSKPILGKDNREHLSSWLNKYVSQTRTYRTYFDDPNNREWFEKKYGFKVHKPHRYLVIGRRSQFSSPELREIQDDHKSLTILTFDDIVDGATAAFYHSS